VRTGLQSYGRCGKCGKWEKLGGILGDTGGEGESITETETETYWPTDSVLRHLLLLWLCGQVALGRWVVVGVSVRFSGPFPARWLHISLKSTGFFPIFHSVRFFFCFAWPSRTVLPTALESQGCPPALLRLTTARPLGLENVVNPWHFPRTSGPQVNVGKPSPS